MSRPLTIADMKRISKETAHHFFDKDNMAHSNSIIESKTLDRNKFFITSEKSPNFGDVESERKYAVHEFEATTGKVLILSGTQAFETMNQAKEYMHSLRELTENQQNLIGTLKHLDYHHEADKVRIAWRTGNKHELKPDAFDKLTSLEKDNYNKGNDEAWMKPPKIKGMER